MDVSVSRMESSERRVVLTTMNSADLNLLQNCMVSKLPRLR